MPVHKTLYTIPWSGGHAFRKTRKDTGKKIAKASMKRNRSRRK